MYEKKHSYFGPLLTMSGFDNMKYTWKNAVIEGTPEILELDIKHDFSVIRGEDSVLIDPDRNPDCLTLMPGDSCTVSIELYDAMFFDPKVC